MKKKIKIIREVDLSKRESVRDALLYLRRITELLYKIWKKMEQEV